MTKYEEITNWIRGRIENGELKDGYKLDSESSLVSRFSVSRQTVRHALSILVGEGLLEKRRGSGTYVKLPVSMDKDRRPKTKRIAVMTTYVNDYIFAPIIQSIESVFSNTDYTMHLSFTSNSIEKERELLQGFIKNENIDALIAEPTKSSLPCLNIELYKELQRKGVPVLQINSYYPDLKATHVSMNDKLAGKLATQYLIEQGHRKIAGIFKSDDGQGGRRYLGYLEAHVENEIPIKENRISWIDTEDIRGSLEAFSGVLKRMEGCTACVCYNDEVADKLLSLCGVYNISVPEKLSVVGIDNSNIAKRTEPMLSSVNNPIDDVGKMAAYGILSLLNGEKPEMSMELDPNMVVRNSVRKC